MQTKPAFSDVTLYPVTGREHFLGRYTDEEAIAALAAGGAKIVQLREKRLDARSFYELALLYRRETERLGMLFIVNDRLDIALASGADGVHLGRNDLPVEAARKIAGPDLIIGASAHSPQQAQEAESAGTSYVNIGPLFPTPTKPGAEGIGLGPLKATLASVAIPVTCMGGITEKNIKEVANAGAGHIGVVSDLFSRQNIEDAARSLITSITGRSPSRR